MCPKTQAGLYFGSLVHFFAVPSRLGSKVHYKDIEVWSDCIVAQADHSLGTCEPPHGRTNKVTWAQRRLRSAWASTQSPWVFTVRIKKACILSYPLSAQRRLWSDWADAQADLSLHWAHIHFDGFVMRQLIWFCRFYCAPSRHTEMILSFRTDMPGQTVQIQIRLLLEQSNQGLHCLPFRLHRLDSLLYCRAT